MGRHNDKRFKNLFRHKMKEENNIFVKAGHRDGLTVPDGYFADFAAKMEQSLPHRDEVEKPRVAPRRTPWQACRPYVYMAAMFAGVWCMLKMFTLMAGSDKEITFDNDPILAEAASDEQVIEEYIVSDFTQSDIYDMWMENYTEEDSAAMAAALQPDSLELSE